MFLSEVCLFLWNQPEAWARCCKHQQLLLEIMSSASPCLLCTFPTKLTVQSSLRTVSRSAGLKEKWRQCFRHTSTVKKKKKMTNMSGKQAAKLSDQNWKRWKTCLCFGITGFGPFAPICQTLLWRFVIRPVFSWLNTCVLMQSSRVNESRKTSKICHFCCQSKLGVWS